MPKRSIRLPAMFDNPQSIKLPAEPHALVGAWMEREREAEQVARKESRETWPKCEDTYMGRRMLRIYDALLKAAEVKGYGLEHPDGQPLPVSLRIKGRLVKWSLEEQCNARHIPLSKTELKKRDNINRGITTEVLYVPTGTFKLIATTGGMKTQISERVHKPFERRIDEVLGRFAKLVDAVIADDIRSAELEREGEEEIKAIERPRRLKVMEKARWDRLREQTRNWHEAKSLRSFIAAVERSLGEDEQTGRMMAWFDWARKRANRLDPLSNGKTSARWITTWRYDPDPSEYELSIWELPP
jgi:hypothetical protein